MSKFIEEEYIDISCDGCGAEYPEMFMVNNSLWNILGFDFQEIYCLTCTEKRLTEKFSRSFEFSDFTDCGLNELLRLGYRLGMMESSKDDRFYKGYLLGKQDTRKNIN